MFSLVSIFIIFNFTVPLWTFKILEPKYYIFFLSGLIFGIKHDSSSEITFKKFK